jgi:hypothetical protein
MWYFFFGMYIHGMDQEKEESRIIILKFHQMIQRNIYSKIK